MRSCIKIFFFIAFIGSSFFSCQNDAKEIERVTKKDTLFPTESGKEVEIFYTDSGQVKVRIKASVMNNYTYNVKEHYTEMPKGLYVEFYNDKGEVKTTLKANYGIKYTESKKIEVKYHVVVTNINHEVLNTEQLFWDENTHKIYTQEFVKITTKKEVLQGKGLEANEDFSEWEIQNPVGTHVDE
ncbi:MAG: LPS export ABC transporter periplasmic protein LptC [Bacteroidetes bacterium]|nr:LPS export ABC transporter periplasmic protein LptC [Bacteroidota bacterium]